MRKFHFKLESVLNLRRMREESALRALGTAQRAFQAELDRKAMLEEELQNALIRRQALGAESAAPASAFRIENDYIVGTRQRIVQAEQGILRARRGVEKALRSYLAAKRQTRTIEILKEKASAEFRKEQGRREQRELDDLSVMRARFREEAIA